MGPGTARLAGLSVLLTCTALFAAAKGVDAQQPARPTFRASVAVVPITALVRDSHNRLVRNLGRDDFQVLEQGNERRIVDFKASEDAPVRLAFLFDTSGSMGIASNIRKGREFVSQMLRELQPSVDEAALFTFHKSLRRDVPFTAQRSRIQRALKNVRPWGLTSLYDAVAETAKELAKDTSTRRAIVVISDGIDTSSALTSQQVAALASSIDVPVYIVAVVSPLDDPTHAAAVVPQTSTGRLADLAESTGGNVLYASDVDQAALIRSELLALIRHQYFLAIESATTPGWYTLEVKTKREGLTVRARRAYLAD